MVILIFDLEVIPLYFSMELLKNGPTVAQGGYDSQIPVTRSLLLVSTCINIIFYSKEMYLYLQLLALWFMKKRDHQKQTFLLANA